MSTLLHPPDFMLYSPWKLCTGMTWCAGKCTGQPTYQRYWGGCHFSILQNSGTSMELVLHFSWAHLSGADASLSAWSPSSPESGLVNLVGPGLTALHCFDGELGMPSSQLSVGWSTSKTSSACGTGVGLLLLSPSTALSQLSCSRLWLMGNRKFLYRVWLHPSLSMGCTTYTGEFG